MTRGFIHCVVLLVATADVLPQDDECLSGDCALHALQSKATIGSACHTAKPGDACYKDIQWAKHTGIKMHPHWYPGLSSHSSDDEFQQIVHSHNPQKCSAPCPKTKNTRCHTALPGDSCYKDVMWAKNHGIREHPNWYHGLSPSSTVEDFQAEIHAKRPDKCPMPCAKAEEPEAVEPPFPGGFPVEEPEEPESHESHESQPAPETTTVTTTRTRQTTEAPHHNNHHHHHEDHDNSYQNSPCNQLHEQREREECFQREIRKEQLEREQREREESEAEQHRQENMPLDERQQEIIDEIGGVPTEDSLPDFDQFDPDR
mmetsp:Transcript_18104/g.30555  ORF Transcript_18104/g.30555 Transcript_18104/m.30555 type:complete len:315 (+) Transcript_18104:57-1001(+)